MADLKVGDIIDGTVTKIVNFGAFVRVREGLEGLIHISELSHQRVAHPGDVVHEGQTIKLKVISLDSERHRLGLSLKQAEEAPARTEAPRERRPRTERAFDASQAVQEPEGGIDNTLAAAFAQVRAQVAQQESARASAETDVIDDVVAVAVAEEAAEAAVAADVEKLERGRGGRRGRPGRRGRRCRARPRWPPRPRWPRMSRHSPSPRGRPRPSCADDIATLAEAEAEAEEALEAAAPGMTDEEFLAARDGAVGSRGGCRGPWSRMRSPPWWRSRPSPRRRSPTRSSELVEAEAAADAVIADDFKALDIAEEQAEDAVDDEVAELVIDGGAPPTRRSTRRSRHSRSRRSPPADRPRVNPGRRTTTRPTWGGSSRCPVSGLAASGTLVRGC